MSLTRIFCVIDPTTPQQRALRRAEGIASAVGIPIHAYVCIDEKRVATRNADREMTLTAEKERYTAWMESLAAPLRERGVTVNIEVDSSEDWHQALAAAAERAHCDLIVKTSEKKPALKRRLIRTADWTLLRSATCPVLFVKTDEQRKLDKIVAAVNLQAEDEKHVALTDEVIAQAKRIAEAFNTELYAANAYAGSDNYVYPDNLARRTGIDQFKCKVADGNPETLLCELTERESIPLVVLGSIARKGLKGAVVGNTAEKILDSLQSDVLVIMQH